MKYYLTFFALMFVGTSGFAQENQQGNYQQQSGSFCASFIKSGTARLKENPNSKLDDNELKCLKEGAAAEANKYSIDGFQPATHPSMDQKLVCNLRKPYTFDFKECKRAVNAYNAVVIAEKTMMAEQKVRQDVKATELQNKTQAEIAKGNGQNAVIDATIEQNKALSNLYKEQAYTYSAAVMALGGAVSAWQGKGKKTVAKLCSSTKEKGEAAANSPIGNKDGTSGKPSCTASVEWVMNNRQADAFANNHVRGQLLTMTADYLIKAAEAKRRAGITEDVANKMSDIPQDILDEDALFEKCQLMPSDPACSNNNRVDTGTFEGSTITFGEGNGNNAFTFGDEAGTEGGSNAGTPKDGSNKISDVTNSFQKEAEKASGILDPASKATMSAGSQNAPGGGGGGGAGGGMGGGGGGGGSDEAAPEGDGEPVIDAKAHKGNFASTGSGFDSVKGSKEEGNPYASLFDTKGENGGIEEDRSIASEDGSGASGLFQKISRRYGQVYDAKRIEANNLE